MRVFADIASGETDWADVFFLAALIVFIVVAVLSFIRKAVESGLTAAGLALVAAGFLVL